MFTGTDDYIFFIDFGARNMTSPPQPTGTDIYVVIQYKNGDPSFSTYPFDNNITASALREALLSNYDLTCILLNPNGKIAVGVLAAGNYVLCEAEKKIKRPLYIQISRHPLYDDQLLLMFVFFMVTVVSVTIGIRIGKDGNNSNGIGNGIDIGSSDDTNINDNIYCSGVIKSI